MWVAPTFAPILAGAAMLELASERTTPLALVSTALAIALLLEGRR